MQMTIILTEQELEFLQNIQNSMNSKKPSERKQFSLEDVVHVCISMAISLGASMHRGQA